MPAPQDKGQILDDTTGGNTLEPDLLPPSLLTPNTEGPLPCLPVTYAEQLPLHNLARPEGPTQWLPGVLRIPVPQAPLSIPKRLCN